MRTSSLARIPILQNLPQPTSSLRKHPLPINLNRHDLHALGPRLRQDVSIDKHLAQHPRSRPHVIHLRIPRIDEQLDGLRKAVRRAARQDRLGAAGVGHVGVEDVAGELADEGVQGREAVGGAVLEGDGEVDLAEGVELGGDLGDGDV